FGVVLVEATTFIGASLQADPFLGGSDTLAIVVGILSVLLTGVAMYVAAIVTANTFATIIAGRVRRIALMRLIGASARSQREEVAGQGLIVGSFGALIGVVLGLSITWAGVAVAARFLPVPEDFSLFVPGVLVPAAGVALSTWLAAWIGSRR